MLLDPFSGDLRRTLPNILGKVPTLVQSLPTDVSRMLLHLVRELTESLILHLSPRDEHTGQEPHGGRTDEESDRILLRDTHGLPRLVLDLICVRQHVTHRCRRRCCRVADARTGAAATITENSSAMALRVDDASLAQQ